MALQSFTFVSQLWAAVSASDKKGDKKGNKRGQRGDKPDTVTNKRTLSRSKADTLRKHWEPLICLEKNYTGIDPDTTSRKVG